MCITLFNTMASQPTIASNAFQYFFIENITNFPNPQTFFIHHCITMVCWFIITDTLCPSTGAMCHRITVHDYGAVSFSYATVVCGLTMSGPMQHHCITVMILGHCAGDIGLIQSSQGGVRGIMVVRWTAGQQVEW